MSAAAADAVTPSNNQELHTSEHTIVPGQSFVITEV